MKLSVGALVVAGVEASHFRAINYNIIQGGSNQVQISRTHAWRRQSSGYSGGCTSTHVAAQTPSSSQGSESCSLLSGGSCGSVNSAYIVTDVEDSLSTANNFCYGYKQDTMAKPSSPYQMSWGSCCWEDRCLPNLSSLLT